MEVPPHSVTLRSTLFLNTESGEGAGASRGHFVSHCSHLITLGKYPAGNQVLVVRFK